MIGREKQRIRQSFSRAAATYDVHAVVQRELALRLAGELPPSWSPPMRILEIGCGTGTLTGMLVERYPAATIVALDFSEAMLAVTRAKLGSRLGLSLVCAEAEAFLADCAASFDLICSNATIQWFDAVETSCANLAHLLPDGGHFIATLFGPRTFWELSLGLNRVFGRPLTLPSERFPNPDRLREILHPLFAECALTEEGRSLSHGSLAELLAQIRRTGTGGGSSLPVALTRGRLAELDAWFLAQFSGYPASFQTMVIRCRK